ncbi:MAG: PD-(D/E)XK nuclease family protein [Chromatiales bacterium]|nr:PD-(D/E)XK nuclease family protein [Chromatiales bacterium]
MPRCTRRWRSWRATAARPSPAGSATSRRGGSRAWCVPGWSRRSCARRSAWWRPSRRPRMRLGGLVLTGRMDRVDELDDGACVILDYKSGKTSIRGWEGERPDEPQLPLYAVDMHQRQPVAAALFAQLRAGELGFNGLAVREGIAPKVKPAGDGAGAWQAVLDGWQATLTRLAESFRAGDARVDPKDYPRTCERCGLQALCRVHERHAAAC